MWFRLESDCGVMFLNEGKRVILRTNSPEQLLTRNCGMMLVFGSFEWLLSINMSGMLITLIMELLV